MPTIDLMSFSLFRPVAILFVTTRSRIVLWLLHTRAHRGIVVPADLSGPGWTPHKRMMIASTYLLHSGHWAGPELKPRKHLKNTNVEKINDSNQHGTRRLLYKIEFTFWCYPRLAKQG